MSDFFLLVFLLGMCLASAANFTSVYEWGPGELDFDWESAAERAQAVQAGIYQPANIYPVYMAVHAGRVFVTLDAYPGIPVNLAWLPTSSASSAPKLVPFPSWHFHLLEGCSCIQEAKGVEVDAQGRLWVLDNGSETCPAKIWVFNLASDALELVHEFPHAVVAAEKKLLSDVVLDETRDDVFAYTADGMRTRVVAFSLRSNRSWTVDTAGKKFWSVAVSRKQGLLLLGRAGSKELYSVPLAEMRAGRPTASLTLVGSVASGWPYSTLVNHADVLYAAFASQDNLTRTSLSGQIAEQPFYQAGPLGSEWPFTFALDRNGTFWLTERNGTVENQPSYKLLKAAIGAQNE